MKKMIDGVWYSAKQVNEFAQRKLSGPVALLLLFVFVLVLGGQEAHAADPTDVAGATTALTANIDQVSTTGIHAAMIAGGLALIWVVIAYIRKAKR